MLQPKKIYGLIGKKVDYSYSPLIHNTGFETLGLPCCYTIFNVADPEQVGDALKGARALGIAGFNVTIPYKKTVVPFMDGLSREASTIGAVNTIVIHEGRMTGHNTDIEGFAAPLRKYADRIRGKNVCIFGNGGAALAAIEAFRMFFHPDEIFLFVRDPDKATEILKGYGHRNLVTLCRQYPVDEIFMDCSVVVNATPIGTKGRPGDMATSIVPPDRKLIHDSQIVYDMVYNPVVTPLLKSAAEAGADTISGIEMLIAQAAGSFRLWTGQALPVDRVRNILMQEIGQGS